MTVNINNTNDTVTPSTGTLNVAGAVASSGLIVNSTTISTSQTIPVGSSASSVGPVTLIPGVTVTVSSGSRWVVL